MRPEGFPPGKLMYLRMKLLPLQLGFNEAGRFPPRKTGVQTYFDSAVRRASMRPEGFPPGKAAVLADHGDGVNASMRPEGFPPGKTSRPPVQTCGISQASMRPEGFPPGKPMIPRGPADVGRLQ